MCVRLLLRLCVRLPPGLEDELATYRKNGYLEKVAFLKKTDEHLEAELKEQRQKERSVCMSMS